MFTEVLSRRRGGSGGGSCLRCRARGGWQAGGGGFESRLGALPAPPLEVSGSAICGRLIVCARPRCISEKSPRGLLGYGISGAGREQRWCEAASPAAPGANPVCLSGLAEGAGAV